MEKLILNETPVRTSRNFNINNIELNTEIPDKIEDFYNVNFRNENSKIIVEDITDIDINKDNYNFTYGVGNLFLNQIKEKSNKKYRITIDSKINKEFEIDFKFDKENSKLVDDIEIIANENAKGTIIIKYESEENLNYFHNGRLNVISQKNSNINVILVNLINLSSNNFISIENKIDSNSSVNYTIIDFGAKNSITNYFSNLIGKYADNTINTIYLGKDNQLFDLNYIGEVRGEKSNINIEVQGALKDRSRKHFKGTIDFKKGCKKSKGNENEACMLLSDTAKSLALPMLLCSEEEVEGNHSSSAGKIGEKELFYIMSRGFEKKEAMKLMVRARFNKILDNIKNENLKNQIIEEINNRLD